MVEPNSGDRNTPHWRVVGASVTGSSHVRKGLPNQDAITWSDELDGGRAAILAVSDGHGSADHFRSHQGSRIAVAITKEALGQLHQRILENSASVSQIRQDLEARLPHHLVQLWTKNVEQDLAANPLTPGELAALEEKAGMARRRNVESRPQLAYGCTLLAILVTRSFVLYLQIGDGDILTVSDGGEVERPLKKDSRLIANETTSLCSPEAWKNASLTVQAISGLPPSLVLASTDGYSNSFVNEEAFLQVGRDLLRISREQSFKDLQRSLDGWLKESSAKSGDDVTLGIIRRLRDTDPERISRQLMELRETTHAAGVLMQDLASRLTTLEERSSARSGLGDHVTGLEELAKKVDQLGADVQALAGDVELRAQEWKERKREEESPLRRWSIGAAWGALILAGAALFCLVLPYLRAPANDQEPEKATTAQMDQTPLQSGGGPASSKKVVPPPDAGQTD